MKIVTTIAPTSTDNQTMKVKKLKEGGFCIFVFLGFVLWWVFFLKSFFITKKLVITYKLNTIKGFYYKSRNFATILIFLDFCHSLGEITKGKKIGNFF